MSNNNTDKLSLFPFSAQLKNNHLLLGGCDTVEIAAEYGTPLYIFDELTLRSKCREFKKEFTSRYQNTSVTYASKAFLNKPLAQLLKEEQIGLDVVSGGELVVAHSISFPLVNVSFHGNNKTPDELNLALNLGVGRIIVDNFYELELLNKLAKKAGTKQKILLRISPGIDAHTHKYTTTGIIDSKFGFPLSTGQAESAVEKALSLRSLDLVGLHFHLGSPIREMSPYELAMDLILKFAKELKQKYKFELAELSPGGGFAVRYTLDSKPVEIAEYAKAITNALTTGMNKYSLAAPKLIIEPGRAIVAQAGVALYTVGSIKDIPNIRKYVCVDGGMGDNIRPALYEAKYTALIANKTDDEETCIVSIAGKYCESGDILIRDINLPSIDSGDLIAIPVNGAYSIPMSSNYNMIRKPAIVMVDNGKARIIRNRESYQDLMRLDVV